MKFIEPSVGPVAGIRHGASVHAREDIPWLTEWIANQGKYVRLECNCRVDLNERNVLTAVTKKHGVKRVYCYFHEEVSAIARSIGLYEFHYGYPPEPLPDMPPY